MGSSNSKDKKPTQKTQGTQARKRNLGGVTTRTIATYMPAEEQDADGKAEGQRLASYLRSKSPFDVSHSRIILLLAYAQSPDFQGRWEVTDVLSSGSYGCVFLCQNLDGRVKGVIKVAKSVELAESLSWEGFVGKKIQESNGSAGFVSSLLLYA